MRFCNYMLQPINIQFNSIQFNLNISIIKISPLTIIYRALLNIIGGKGAISNINYYY